MILRAWCSGDAMTDQIDLTVSDTASPDECAAIIGGLVRFNDVAASPARHLELCVVARANSSVIGGLLGFTNWNWLFIKQLWVAEIVRGRGVGAQLLAAAEREALARGCAHAHVDTFGFQARPFYEKLGYVVFGQLDDYPAGHTRYFLQKRHLV
jgi:GNAT superfamily N-acetyltransferase